MAKIWTRGTTIALAFLVSSVAYAQQPSPAPATADPAKQVDALGWVDSPNKPPITARATIALPQGVRYLAEADTNKFLEITGNLPEENSYTVADAEFDWFAIFNFDEIGYVKDDEKIDAPKLLKSMQDGQEAQNAERASQGLEPLTIVGWSVAPHYDTATKNLEYGLILSSPSGRNVNYTTRILGRKGVMTADLVSSEEDLQANLVEFRKTLAAFAYAPDESYAAYKQGDAVSDVSLGGLIAGGAAVAALAKGGFFKVLIGALAAGWKFIAIGVVALFGAIRSLFNKGKKEEDVASPAEEVAVQSDAPAQSSNIAENASSWPESKS